MDDRIAREWRREEPHGSVYRADHKTRSGVERRWYAQFRARDYNGKTVTYRDTRSTTKVGAQRALLELKARALAAKQPPAAPELEPQTLAAYLEQWHKHRVDTGLIRPSTEADEERYIKLLSELIGTRRLREIASADVEQLLVHLQTVRFRGKHRSVQQAFRCLRKALADVRPRLSPNPCDMVDRPKVAKADTRTFTREELRSVLQAADKPLPGDTVVDDTFSTLVHFLAGTGCRISEALGLVWADVALDSQAVHFRKALARVRKLGSVRAEPKTKSAVRTVPINSDLAARLKALRTQDGAIAHATAHVFSAGGGAPLHASNVLRRRWHPLLESVKLERCGFHRLRHTYASLMLQAGLDINTTSRLLGHASPAITLGVYSHFLPGREKEAAAIFEAAVAGSV